MTRLSEEAKLIYQRKFLESKSDTSPLTKLEIHDVLTAAGGNPSDSDVNLAYELLCNTKYGYEDFMLLVDQLVQADSTEVLRELFDSLDSNHDGVLQYEEVLNGFKSLGIEITPDEVNQIFKDADENGDQVLQFDEFVKVVGQHL